VTFFFAYMPPKLSVIIPVYHEESTIQSCMHHIQDSVAYEIIVVDAIGTTLKHVPNTCVKLKSKKKGRAYQMNLGAKHAKAPYLLFLHADTHLPKKALSKIINLLNKKANITAGAFDLQFDDLKYYPLGWLASLRSRITRIPYGDQAIFIRKEIFNQIEGFADVPILEDVRLMETLKKKKQSIYIFSKSVKTSTRRWKKEGFLKQTLKNRLIMYRYKRA